jgi:hypothetical protein
MRERQQWSVSMSKIKFIMMSAIPLIMASVAMAAEPPTRPGSEPQREDPAVMHQRMCEDHYAGRAGEMAYLEARLALTDAQRPLFAKWRQSVLDGASKERTACQALTVKGDTPPTIVEREDHMQKMLSAKLQEMQSSQPALQALYDALTPDQRAILDHPHHHHGGGMHGFGMEGPMMPPGAPPEMGHMH